MALPCIEDEGENRKVVREQKQPNCIEDDEEGDARRQHTMLEQRIHKMGCFSNARILRFDLALYGLRSTHKARKHMVVSKTQLRKVKRRRRQCGSGSGDCEKMKLI